MSDAETPERRDPWLKWFPSDWRSDPRLRSCSLTARGLWIEMIGLMHEATPYGHLVINGRKVTDIELARQVGATQKEVAASLAELSENGVFSVAPDSGAIYSRRLVRMADRSRTNTANGKNGGSPKWRRGVVPKEQRVGPLSSDAKKRLLPELWEACGGRCKLCGVGLVLDDGEADNFAHVDHIVARCDGGTHDPSNLRLLCRSCNHDRKNVEPTDEQGDEPTEIRSEQGNRRTNTQKPEARSQTPIAPVGVPQLPEESIAGEFLERIPETYAKCRSGAVYRTTNRTFERDFGAAVDVARLYPNIDRLLSMYEIFLRRTDIGPKNNPGTPGQFAHMAPDCDRLLRENGR